jgi:hypothetical protein
MRVCGRSPKLIAGAVNQGVAALDKRPAQNWLHDIGVEMWGDQCRIGDANTSMVSASVTLMPNPSAPIPSS